MENNKHEKLEVKGITIHFCTEDTQEGYVESCRIMYNEGVREENMSSVYMSIKNFYNGFFFEDKK